MHRRLRDLTSRLSGAGRGSQAPAPCLPCQQQDGVRQFSLTAPAGPSVTDDFVPTLNPDVAWATIDGHLVLHDPWREHLHVLNSTAAFIWACVDDVSTTAELIDQVLIETEGPPETVAADVRAVLAQFLHSNIVLAEPTKEPGVEGGSTEPERDTRQRAREARQLASQERTALVLEHRHWLPGIGPRQAVGASVLVRTNAATVGAYLDAVLAALPAADALPSTSSGDVRTISVVDRGHDGPHRYRVYRDHDILLRAPGAADAIDRALSEVNLLAIEHTPDRLLFHGGAVEREGVVIALLAPSGRGKSTLAAALVQRGWAYLSDELVTVDPRTHWVDPFPKALDLSEDSLDLLGAPDALTRLAPGKRQILPTALGRVSAGGRLGLVVVLTDESQHPTEGGACRPQAPLDSLQEMLLNTFRETMASPGALDHLVTMCQAVPTVTLARTDLDAECAAVERYVASSAFVSADSEVP